MDGAPVGQDTRLVTPNVSMHAASLAVVEHRLLMRVVQACQRRLELVDAALTAAGVPSSLIGTSERLGAPGAIAAPPAPGVVADTPVDGPVEPSPTTTPSHSQLSLVPVTVPTTAPSSSAVDAAELLEQVQRERTGFHAHTQVRVHAAVSARTSRRATDVL